jgi:hypothetical protein
LFVWRCDIPSLWISRSFSRLRKVIRVLYAVWEHQTGSRRGLERSELCVVCCLLSVACGAKVMTRTCASMMRAITSQHNTTQHNTTQHNTTQHRWSDSDNYPSITRQFFQESHPIHLISWIQQDGGGTHSGPNQERFLHWWKALHSTSWLNRFHSIPFRAEHRTLELFSDRGRILRCNDVRSGQFPSSGNASNHRDMFHLSRYFVMYHVSSSCA